MTALAQLDLDDQLLWLTDPRTSEEEIEEALSIFPQHERDAIISALDAVRLPVAPWVPLDHQVPPPLSEAWYGWLLLGGRGAGKSAAVTHWLNDHALGPPCLSGPIPHRMGIIAPTLGDASASIVYGDDGLAVINPEVRQITRQGGTVVVWPNGAYAYLLGTNTLKDVDRCRAKGNRCADLREEIAAWPRLAEATTQLNLGLRKGIARWVGATTPKPRPTIRRLAAAANIRVSTATTADNSHLPDEVKERFYEEYANTSVGVQELEGKILDDVTGALWTQELIEQYRVTPQQVPELRRVRTYVDPSWGTTNDECGIVVAGRGVDGHVYILSDLSKRTTPIEWGMLAAVGRLPAKGQHPSQVEQRTWFGKRSELVGYETNFQGQQVKDAMKLTAQALGRRVRHRPINASKGKRLRAEPVLLMFEQGRVHIVGSMPGLEFQLTSWVPPEAGKDTGDPGDPEENIEEGAESSKWSPDRLDAMCIAAGTPVLTEHGWTLIEAVKIGEQAWTRQGWRPVIDAGLTRKNAEVVQVDTEDSEPLILTPDHRVWVEEKGWTRADALAFGDRLSGWNLPLSLSSTECGTSAIPTPHNEPIGCITRPEPVLRSVHGVFPVSARDVYDLTVEGEHEFVAAGVIVHNCFACTDLLLGPGSGSNRVISTMSFGAEEMSEPMTPPPVPAATPVPAPMLPRIEDIPMRAPGR